MNSWIKHVKQVQAQTGLSYKDAMIEAKKTYKKNKISGKGAYSKGLIYDPNIDYSKYFIKGMPNPKSKGGKVRGRGFWDNVLNVVDKVGNTAGNVVSSALGKEMGGIPLPNPYSMGRDLGENYIGPALRKQIKGY